MFENIAQYMEENINPKNSSWTATYFSSRKPSE